MVLFVLRCRNTFSHTAFFDVAMLSHTQPFSMSQYFLTHSLFRCRNTFSHTAFFDVAILSHTQTPTIWYFTPKLQCFLTFSLKGARVLSRQGHALSAEEEGWEKRRRKKKHHTNEKAKTNKQTNQTNKNTAGVMFFCSKDHGPENLQGWEWKRYLLRDPNCGDILHFRCRSGDKVWQESRCLVRSRFGRRQVNILYPSLTWQFS